MEDTTHKMTWAGKDNRLNVTIEQDSDCGNPWEECDGSWTLYSLSRHHRQKDGIERWIYDGAMTIGLRKKLSVGLAFVLDYYEHSGSAWSISGEGMNCPWDTAQMAGLMVWENKPGDMGAKSKDDRREDARRCLAVYNAWANGSCYGYSIETGQGEDVNSCWGFIDFDDDGGFYMFDEIRFAVDGYRKENGFIGCEIVTEEEYEEMVEDAENSLTDTGFDDGVLYVILSGDSKWLADYNDVAPKPAMQKAA